MKSEEAFYRKLAYLMAAIHGLWIALVLLSLPLVIVQPSLRWVTLGVVIINISAWVIWRDCPLHLWENSFRHRYDPQSVYQEAFISHYVHKLFHINISTVVVRVLVYSYAAVSVAVAFLVHH